MAYEIVWADEAVNTFENIINYLLYKFTEKEVSRFVNAVEKKINLIKINPYSYRKSKYAEHLHYTIVLRKTILVYRIKDSANIIELIHFWDGRQNHGLTL